MDGKSSIYCIGLHRGRGEMEHAIRQFTRRIHSGLVQDDAGHTLMLKELPATDPDHPQYVYDTFFMCMAYYIKGDPHRRRDVRDELICLLGAIVFGQSYIRGHDVVDTALRGNGPRLLRKRLHNTCTRQYIMNHYAVRVIVHHAGAYVGCNQDPKGGQRLGQDPSAWSANPDAFSYAIGRFVDDNLGDIPSAPRRGIPLHQAVKTTCYAVFMHLATQQYTGWRPVVWSAQNNGSQYRVACTEYRPDFTRIATEDSAALAQDWYNSAQPLYMFYNGHTKRFKLLCPLPTGDMHQEDVPAGAVFRLRKSSKNRRKNTHVGFFTPPSIPIGRHETPDPLHSIQIEPFQIDPHIVYMIHPANMRDKAFQIPVKSRVYGYVRRPAESVANQAYKERLKYLWELPGPQGSQLAIEDDLDSIIGPLQRIKPEDLAHQQLQNPPWPAGTEHVFMYRAHEARTGLWPAFQLDKDTCEMVIVLATNDKEAENILQRARPHQPLITIDVSGIQLCPTRAHNNNNNNNNSNANDD